MITEVSLQIVALYTGLNMKVIILLFLIITAGSSDLTSRDYPRDDKNLQIPRKLADKPLPVQTPFDEMIDVLIERRSNGEANFLGQFGEDNGRKFIIREQHFEQQQLL